jgi:N-acetylglucosaminyldiphosphoundecaprenol N-acetyl-beta-D-mannosaminyltransferase
VKLPSERLDILGIPIDFSNLPSVVPRILDAARDHRPFQVATVNLDFLVNSQRDEEVRSILLESQMNIPDGTPVVWAARLLGQEDAVRLAGADLVPALVGAAADEGLSVFLLGGENGAAADAARHLSDRFPSAIIDYFEPPCLPLNQLDDDEILDRIAMAQPHILLVAFGHPKQEKWIRRHRAVLPMAAIGVGCSLDLIAGRQSRAPRWMQKTGLEWSYRMVHEPRRLAPRYASNFLGLASDLAPWLVAQRLNQTSLRTAQRV